MEQPKEEKTKALSKAEVKKLIAKKKAMLMNNEVIQKECSKQ